jgi:hypothetical protein
VTLLVIGHQCKTMLFHIDPGIHVVPTMIHQTMQGQKYGFGAFVFPDMDISLNAITTAQFFNTVL